MRTTFLGLLTASMALLFLWACYRPPEPQPPPREDETEPREDAGERGAVAGPAAATVLVRTLSVGDTGDEVERLHDYLEHFGYFPSARLEQLGLRPVIDKSPKDPRMFDEVLQLGLFAFQKRARLKPTGQLDRATRRMLARPRCGFPDHGGRLKGHSYRWNMWGKQDVTYAFANYTTQVTRPQARAALDGAAATWDAACGLTLTRVSRGADIWVSWQVRSHGDGYAFDGPRPDGTIIAHGWPPVSAYDGDVHFDNEDPWTTTHATLAFDLQTIALHELGHSLGLGHNEDDPGSIMWPWWDPGVGNKQHALAPVDILNIRWLYGP